MPLIPCNPTATAEERAAYYDYSDARVPVGKPVPFLECNCDPGRCMNKRMSAKNGSVFFGCANFPGTAERPCCRLIVNPKEVDEMIAARTVTAEARVFLQPTSIFYGKINHADGSTPGNSIPPFETRFASDNDMDVVVAGSTPFTGAKLTADGSMGTLKNPTISVDPPLDVERAAVKWLSHILWEQSKIPSLNLGGGDKSKHPRVSPHVFSVEVGGTKVGPFLPAIEMQIKDELAQLDACADARYVEWMPPVYREGVKYDLAIRGLRLASGRETTDEITIRQRSHVAIHTFKIVDLWSEPGNEMAIMLHDLAEDNRGWLFGGLANYLIIPTKPIGGAKPAAATLFNPDDWIIVDKERLRCAIVAHDLHKLELEVRRCNVRTLQIVEFLAAQNGGVFKPGSPSIPESAATHMFHSIAQSSSASPFKHAAGPMCGLCATNPADGAPASRVRWSLDDGGGGGGVVTSKPTATTAATTSKESMGFKLINGTGGNCHDRFLISTIENFIAFCSSHDLLVKPILA